MTADSLLSWPLLNWLQAQDWLALSFSRRGALLALALVPVLVILVVLDGQRRRRLLERIGHLPQIRRLTASVSVPRRRLKWTLVVTAAALLVMAVAGPQRPGQARMLPRRGLDIVVALDFSRSMLAADIYPSRLERAKLELGKLIDGLRGDRVGLVAFAGVTLSYPLTSDYAAAKLFWRDLQPGDIPVGGTNLGEAVRASLELLAHAHDNQRDKRRPSQIVILLTDGADTEGGAAEAVRLAARQGVKIFPVGIGSREGEVVVLKRNSDGSAEYVTDPLGKPVRMELDEPALRQMALATAGEYFAFDAERFGVERVQKAIAGLERIEEEGRVVREPDEAYGWFTAGALALLAIELLLGDRRPGVPSATAEALAAPVDAAPRGRRRLGGRRRAGSPARTDARGAALLLLLALPWLGGWSWFERPSPDVAEGNRALAAGKPQEALAAYERALAVRPDDLAIHYDRGAALYALGRMPEALREFERAAESSDTQLRADANYNAGNAHLKQDHLAGAVAAYKRALHLRPDDRRAKWNLELALRRQQEQERKQQAKDEGDGPQKQNPDGEEPTQNADKPADPSAQRQDPRDPQDPRRQAKKDPPPASDAKQAGAQSDQRAQDEKQRNEGKQQAGEQPGEQAGKPEDPSGRQPQAGNEGRPGEARPTDARPPRPRP